MKAPKRRLRRRFDFDLVDFTSFGMWFILSSSK
jgi:hypothetical protein